MPWFIFFLTAWIVLGAVARLRRLSWILSIGGSLILALLLLMGAVTLISGDSSKPTASKTAEVETQPEPVVSVDAAWTEMWVALPPPPPALQGMSVTDAEKLYFRLCVMDWNREIFLWSRANTASFSELAEKWEMHVDVIDGVYRYVHLERVGRISEAVKTHFESHPHVQSASVQPTAWGGLYTLGVRLEVEGSPKDPLLQVQAEKLARDLVASLPRWMTGLKISSVSYHWPKTGTSGYLGPAYLWRRHPEEFRVMSTASELSTRTESIEEKSWIQPSWNEGRRATE